MKQMDFEYGCAITNKYGFLNENDEVEDPSELLAQVSVGQVPAAGKKAAPGAKTAAKPGDAKKTGKPVGDSKKPLQQTDNSVKSAKPLSQQAKTGLSILFIGYIRHISSSSFHMFLLFAYYDVCNRSYGQF